MFLPEMKMQQAAAQNARDYDFTKHKMTQEGLDRRQQNQLDANAQWHNLQEQGRNDRAELRNQLAQGKIDNAEYSKKLADAQELAGHWGVAKAMYEDGSLSDQQMKHVAGMVQDGVSTKTIGNYLSDLRKSADKHAPPLITDLPTDRPVAVGSGANPKLHEPHRDPVRFGTEPIYDKTTGKPNGHSHWVYEKDDSGQWTRKEIPMQSAPSAAPAVTPTAGANAFLSKFKAPASAPAAPTAAATPTAAPETAAEAQERGRQAFLQKTNPSGTYKK